MSKHRPLIIEDVNKKAIKPEFQINIDNYATANKISNSDIRILDFGSGRGALVLKLIRQGFDVYGVDVDEEPINYGLPLFYKLGIEGKEKLMKIDIDCKTPFESEFFDIVLSDQVVEHVQEINNFFNEIHRVIKSGGITLHYFPHYLKFEEAHLFMPLIQYLPKNFIRFSLIFIYVLLGIEPRWNELKGLGKLKKARVYYQYSIYKTFYRSDSELQKILSDTKFHDIKLKSFSNKFKFYMPSTWFPTKSFLYAKK